MSGTVEHNETLTYLINHSKAKQKSLVVTLIDLKNAFGDHDVRLVISSCAGREKIIINVFEDLHSI